MQCDDFMSDEILARRKTIWNLSRVRFAVHDVLLNPSRWVISFLAGLVNLEPFGIRRVELVTSGTSTRGHVGYDRTGVMRPVARTVSPLEGYSRAWVGIYDHRSGLCILAAHEVFIVRTFDWVNGGDLADRRGFGVSIGGISRISDSINSKKRHVSVGVHRE